MKQTRLYLLLLTVFCLFWCLNVQATGVYLMKDVAERSEDPVQRAQAQEVQAIYDSLAGYAGVQADLCYSSDLDINAFATETESGKEKLVVIQEGMLNLMKEDRDAVAAVLGHELAHHKLDHIEAGKRKKEGMRAFGAILGAVVGVAVGYDSGSSLAGDLANAAVGAAAGLLVLKFNRNQEMAADRLSLQWTAAAGFNPQGMLRMQKTFAGLGGKKHKSSILSTHPTSVKRYKMAEKLLAKTPPSKELLDRPVTPLVTEEALATVSSSSSSPSSEKAQEERIVTLLESAKIPAAALIAPLDKQLSFEKYAALSNELFYLGSSEKSKFLSKNNLTNQQWEKVNKEYQDRVKADSSVSSYYAMFYYRATQGRFAIYGQDLADSYEKGQGLQQQQPPVSIETQLAMHKALKPYETKVLDSAARSEIDKKVLAPFGINYYDYTVSQMWWGRKAKIVALAGDTALLRQMLEAGQHIEIKQGEHISINQDEHVSTPAIKREKNAN